MSNIIEFTRARVKKGDVIVSDFDYSPSFLPLSTINPANVVVGILPSSQVSYGSPVTVSGQIVQVKLDTTNGVIGQEYLVDVYATSSAGEKNHLLLVLIIEPNA